MLLLLSLLACPPAKDVDADGDGFLASIDCDDSDPAVGDGSNWYADGDGDGFGSATITVVDCAAPAGFIADNTDCDDGNAAAAPGAAEHCDGVDEDCDGVADNDPVDPVTFYADADGDTYGDANAASTGCSAPAGAVSDANDCNDGDAAISPAASETCNGVDDNCDGNTDENPVDGTTYYQDQDGDGFGDAAVQACTQPTGSSMVDGDCDDGAAGVFPGADEYCNGQDDNCDTSVDEATAVDVLPFYLDSDGDGYGNATIVLHACAAPAGAVADPNDCNDGDPAVHPNAAEHCDGTDEDCDGVADNAAVDQTIWYADTDGDGYGDPRNPLGACTQPAGYLSDTRDCDDTSATVYPNAAEYCNSADDDCDGTVDESDAADAPFWYADGDGDGYGSGAGVPSCTAIAGAASMDGDCDDNDAAHSPATAEHCDGTDENCDGVVDNNPVDGQTWCGDVDGDGFGDPAAVSTACTQPAGSTANADDCDDSDANVSPNADEYCDGVDEDCDGTIDNNPLDPTTWYADIDGDGYGDSGSSVVDCTAPAGYVTDHTDCNDADPAYTVSCKVGCTTITPYPGNVFSTGFGTANALSGFCNSYNAVSGDLTLEQTDLKDMSVLSCLCEVDGDVTITGNSALTTLSGLDKLGTIGGDLYIDDNDKLPNYRGIGVETVGGTLIAASGNALISDFEGFDYLTTVGDLYVYYSVLTSLDGLETLTTVTGDLSLIQNESLLSVQGLSGVTSVGGDLYLYNNDLLPSLTGMEQISSVGQDLIIDGVDAIPDLTPLSGVGSVGQNLQVTNCDLILDLSGLEGITTVPGDVTISGNNVEDTLKGLDNLNSVGGTLYIYQGWLSSYQGMNALTNAGKLDLITTAPDMQGFDALTTVTGDVYVNSSASATMNGASKLQSIGGAARFYNMGSVQGLSGLQSIGGDLTVTGASDYTGLTALKSVGGKVSSLNNSCTGLSALQSVGTLELSNDAGSALSSLTSVQNLTAWYVEPTGLPTIATIPGNVSFYQTATMSGMNGLTSIGGDLIIHGDYYATTKIYTITGFSGLKSIGGDLEIQEIYTLQSIPGFSALSTLGGSLNLVFDTSLADISALSHLTQTGGLYVYYTGLGTLNGLHNLSAVNGDLRFSANSSLTSLAPLYALQSVTGNFEFTYNALSTAEANALVNNIGASNIGGTITISE